MFLPELVGVLDVVVGLRLVAVWSCALEKKRGGGGKGRGGGLAVAEPTHGELCFLLVGNFCVCVCVVFLLLFGFDKRRVGS